MQINRIIFLSQDRFSERNFKRFGIQLLMDRGFHVEFWECSPFLMPVLFETFHPPDTFTFHGFKLFYSEKLLLEAIAGLTPSDIMLTYLGGVHIKTCRIYKKITEQDIPWGVNITGRVPVSPELKGFKSRVVKLIENPVLLVNFLFKKIPVSWFKLRPFQFILTEGTAPLSNDYLELSDSKTDILNVHGVEYDLFLESREQKNAFNTEYVVFLDGCGPMHPDRLIFKNQYPCSKEEYFSNLNSFFKFIEQRLGCEVIIAAHPKSRYDEIPDLFEGRQIIRGKTHDLVKNSKFVITFFSTSVHFAVIYKKPIIFLAINPYRRNELDLKTTHIASQFGKLPVYWNGENSVNLEIELEMDDEKYSQYFDYYLKKQGSPEQYSWDIFADYLESL